MYQVPNEEFLPQTQINQNKRGKTIGILFMIGSVIITIIFGLLAYQSFEKYSWSETKGIVTNSIFFESVANDEANYYYDYEYDVDGVTYTGKDSETGKYSTVAKPPAEGTSINVYYNPNDPSESLVDTNYSDALSDSVVWTLCCGPIFFLFGALLYFMSTRKK